MKNSYTVALVIISVVATAIYMDSKGQSEEVTPKDTTLKDNIVNAVAEKSKKTLPDKDVVVTANGVESADATFELVDKSGKPSFIIGKSKALNSKVVQHHLEVADFQSVISSLSQFQSEEEIEREYELAQAINDELDLSVYPNNYGCGGGICAVELLDISNEELVNVNQLIPKTMNFKALTIQTVTMLDGTNSIRVIGGSSSDTNSITLN